MVTVKVSGLVVRTAFLEGQASGSRCSARTKVVYE